MFDLQTHSPTQTSRAEPHGPFPFPPLLRFRFFLVDDDCAMPGGNRPASTGTRPEADGEEEEEAEEEAEEEEEEEEAEVGGCVCASEALEAAADDCASRCLLWLTTPCTIRLLASVLTLSFFFSGPPDSTSLTRFM
mmetsp:Transcript_17393/g.40845  ORF Transcript_17393/g.40845 Transcript_17393/m.40845 type:complete len:136 (+) Transcript_17393:90-497(+)